MNNEVERYVGELREFRERELKLAKLVTAMEEHLQGGYVGSTGPNGSSRNISVSGNVQRLLDDPQLTQWIDRLRAEGKAPIKRSASRFPSYDEDEAGS